MSTARKEAPPPEPAEPQEPHLEAEPQRATLLERLNLDPFDLKILAGLAIVAFVFRFFSPLMPDLLTKPFVGAPISNCVHGTPVDAANDLGTLCGLAYPFQRNYAQSGQQPTPPNGQVFDEIYFATFAHDDLTGVSYFDPEPPLSKLLIASGEWLWGWWRATFQGAKGSFADLGFNTFGWRVMAAVFGTLCVPMMYLLARQLWPASRLFAVAAGVLTCFDGMFFVQSRIGMIDIFPIFFILLAYTVFLVHLRSRDERESLVTLLLTGLVLGLAIAAKWIALAAWASVIFFLVMRPVRRRVQLASGGWSWGAGEGPEIPGAARRLPYLATGLVALLAIPLVIYIASWIPFFERGQFHNLNDLWQYQVQTYDYHAHLTATHPYGSAWFSWPFLFRPVAYYYQEGLGADAYSGQPLVGGIVDLGNPWIWWTSLPCLLALPYFILRHRSWPATLIAVGFLTQYLPWSRVTRVLFLYHMFGGLIFMVLALAFTLAWLATTEGFVLEAGAFRVAISGRQLVYAHLAIAVAFFLYFYPVWTALPITQHAYLSPFPDGKMWLKTWI